MACHTAGQLVLANSRRPRFLTWPFPWGWLSVLMMRHLASPGASDPREPVSEDTLQHLGSVLLGYTGQPCSPWEGTQGTDARMWGSLGTILETGSHYSQSEKREPSLGLKFTPCSGPPLPDL